MNTIPIDSQAAFSRRDALLAGLGAAALIGAEAAPTEPTVRLRPKGQERQLPNRWLGYNSPAPYNIPIEDPQFVSAVATLKPQYLRFPGGTVANYYQWRTGVLDPGDQLHNRAYTQFAERSRQLHPHGVFIKQYVELCRRIEADLLVVPNLETSSIDEQGAWFAQMNADGYRPSNIEMGNEFYLALLMNPVILKKFPDWASTIKLTKQYVEAIRPYIAKDARIAVQAAGTKFDNPTGKGGDWKADGLEAQLRLGRRELEWDQDMRPEPWFDAVTTHLYPGLEGSAGPGALQALAAEPQQVFAAFMARADEGFDRTLSDTAARMPGKEIWVTEWGAGEPQALREITFDGLWFHMIARSVLAMLRHPEVTVSTNQGLFCDGNMRSAFRRFDTASGRLYAPINATGVLGWFFDASRGPDAHYRALKVEGGARLLAHGAIDGEGYRDVDACLLRKGRQQTAFIQNATSTGRRVDLSELVGASTPLDVQAVATPDLLSSLEQAAPRPVPSPGPSVHAAPYSVTRIVWRI